MSTAPEPADPQVGMIFGHCRLERKLGEGGMGMVYLATHTTLNKMVAVKLLRADLSGDRHAAERFLREARSAARVEHPAVVQVHDIGQQEGTFYIVMQYVEGSTLEGLLRKQATLPLAEAARIIRAVCEGVRVAHQNGVIHRDIKPDNILLGKDGSVKLTDFGLARAMEGDPNLSQTGKVFGTPHYMSPEQALGEKVDLRSDVFSLGATFYRAVTGRYPFHATSVMAVVYKLTHETPPPARDVNPAVPAPVSDLLEDMMARDPRERLGSMDEVLRRLEEALQPSASSRASGLRRSGGRGPTRGRRAAPPKKGIRRQVIAALLGTAALGGAAFLVIQRYGLPPLPRFSFSSPSASAESKPAGSRPGGRSMQRGTHQDATDTVAAARAAASLAAGRDSPRAATSAPDGPREPGTEEAGAERKKSLEEKRALGKRSEELLRSFREDPASLSRFIDPEAREEKSDAAVWRMMTLLLGERAASAPPVAAGEITLRPEGRADVSLEGLGRPAALRWVKRRGEWYLAAPRRP